MGIRFAGTAASARSWLVLICFLGWLGAASAALAQAYPSKPVRLIVPFPPGGGFDAIGRPFAERVGPVLGQAIVIDYRPGASGNIGAAAAARSAPDGYTLLLGNDFLALNAALSGTPGYDAVADLAAVGMIGTVPTVLVINPALAARDFRQLASLSKAKPLNFGSPAPGSVGHLLGELMNLEDTVKMVHVPYKGSGPAVTDTVGGIIDAVIVTLPSVSAFIRAGKLRAIGSFSLRRPSAVPDMPTIAEAGGPAATGDVWYGIFAPGGTPEAVIRRLSEASVAVLRQAQLADTLRNAGFEPAPGSPAELAAQLKGDIEKWGRLARAAGVGKE
jgi:tripartite-type tricarboxylate transporter receptor subunit TctC